MNDTFYPGWEAAVDGSPQPIVTANYLFRAVRVPAGPHRVEFAYRPRSVRLGLIATGLGWGFVLVLGTRHGGQRQAGVVSSPHTPPRR